MNQNKKYIYKNKKILTINKQTIACGQTLFSNKKSFRSILIQSSSGKSTCNNTQERDTRKYIKIKETKLNKIK